MTKRSTSNLKRSIVEFLSGSQAEHLSQLFFFIDGDEDMKPPKRKRVNAPKDGSLKEFIASHPFSRSNFNESLPLSVDFVTMDMMTIPRDWHTKAAANRAARGEECLARLMGFITLSFHIGGQEVYHELIREYRVHGFDENGEFNREYGEIGISSLLDALHRETMPITPMTETREMLDMVWVNFI